MKKNLLIIGVLSFLCAPAYAELTVDDTVNPEYLRNHGYSSNAVYYTQKQIAQYSGNPYKQSIEKEYYGNPVVKHVRRFFMYMDPALDDHSFMNDHDIKGTTTYTDL